MIDTRERIVVIGAGIAGLAAARTLIEHGRDVVVLDKGRGPGGRASVRRHAGFEFDHGAQYFTVDDPGFGSTVQEWIDRGVVAEWKPRLCVFNPNTIDTPRHERARYVGVPAMNALARRLADGIDVRCGTRVATLQRDDPGKTAAPRPRWRVADADGTSLGTFDTVLVTVPPAQAAPLLREAHDMAERVAQVTMLPCWAVLLGFDAQVDVDFDAAFVNTGPLEWVARNTSKPGRQGGEAWVLHASARWTQESFDQAPEHVVRLLRDAFETLCVRAGCTNPPAVRASQAHRWAYAKPEEPLPDTHQFDVQRRIGVAGDWCGGPRVEGAYLSGTALAQRVLEAPAPR